MPTLRLIVAALLASACAATPSTPAEYLLSNTQSAPMQQSHDRADAAFGRLTVADYLDRPEIVLETDDGVIRPAFSHRWAEPLAPALRRALARRITAGSGLVVLPEATTDSPTVVDLSIERLHGTQDGRVLLAARWSVRRGDATSYHTLAETVLTSADGYPALVSAHDELIRVLAAAVGQSLRPRPGS